MSPHRLRPALLLLAVVLAVGLTGCSGDAAASPSPDQATTPRPTATRQPASAATSGATPARTPTSLADGPAGPARVVAGDPHPAPPLVGLVNSDGSAFDLADYRGSPTLLFFGYTHCPDVCPATIGELFGVFEARPEVKAIFVTVDPERDTPEFLEAWTRYFPDDLNAVTGSPGTIRRAADAYGVRYARVETTSTAGYTMSHTADVYLIDPQGLLLQAYPFGTPAETMIADVSRLIAD